MQTILLFISILLFVISTMNCGNNEYPVKISTKDGIRLIQNPEYPKFEDARYSLEEVLTIGLEDGDPNYVFHYIESIDIDLEGSIYVLDAGNYRIQVFDKEGRYLRTIGKKGLGPGEFDSARGISLGSDGKLFTMEYYLRKITCFSKNGEYISDFRINEKMLVNLHVYKNILYLECAKLKFQENKADPIEIRKIVKVDENGKIIKNLGEFMGFKAQRVGNFFFMTKFEPELTWTVDAKGKIYTGYGNKYQISMVDTNGIEKMKFGREFKRSRISSKEKDKDMKKVPKHLRDKFELPELKPVFKQIITDDEGNIWVNLFEKDENGDEQYDIFNQEGIYLRTVTFKNSLHLIKNGFAYAIVSSENGIPMIKKYKIEQKIFKNSGT